MDENFRIYRDAIENIPKEDRARLEGFLEGRAEADEEKRTRENVEALLAEIEKRSAVDEGGEE